MLELDTPFDSARRDLSCEAISKSIWSNVKNWWMRTGAYWLFPKLCVCVLTKSGSFATWSLPWGTNLLFSIAGKRSANC